MSLFKQIPWFSWVLQHPHREKVESVTGSHLKEPLEVSTKKGMSREEASRESGREASHIWPCEAVRAVPVLSAHFSLFPF